MSPSGPAAVAIRALLVLSFLSGTRTEATEPKCSEGICIHEIEDATSVRFEAENTRFFDISVHFSLAESTNAEAVHDLPLIRTIGARSRAQLTTIRPVEPRARWSYKYLWEFAMGDPDAKHDGSFRYRLPYSPAADKVVQADPGGESLPGPTRHEVVFDMPYGTPVLAARAGVVCQITDGFPDGGLDPEAVKRSNTVTVRHADGTYGSYSHLKAGSMTVRDGTSVEAGQKLALSGASGWTARPVLSFMVWKATPGMRRTSLPVPFDAPLTLARTPLPDSARGGSATLRVKCSEDDCLVLLMSTEVGRTTRDSALALSVPANQDVVLRVKKDGFLEHGQVLFLEPGRVQEIFADLVRIPKEPLDETASGPRAWFGAEVAALTPEVVEAHGLRGFKGVIVVKVDPGSPAAEAGLKVDDVIHEFDGKPIRVPIDLTRILDRLRVGQRVPVGILSNFEERKLRVTVSERPK